MCDSILDFFKNYSLDIYKNLDYILVEISPQLAQVCEDRLSKKHRELYKDDRIKIYNSSILDFNKKINDHCFIIGMEILDNMPHDRVYLEDGEITKQAMIEISEDKNGNEVLNEVREDIDDVLILEFMKHLESMPQKDHIMVNKKMQVAGMIKRIKDFWEDYRHHD